MPLHKGEVLAHRYVVERPLGEGGMGTAYLVHDTVHESSVALKLLRRDEPSLVAAFRAEFSRLRGLAHPHLCRVHDLGRARGAAGALVHYYTAEYVPGEPLHRFAQGRAWAEVAVPLGHALSALGFLHGLGIVHGDFKPANVLAQLDGRGVLIDLSSSRPLGSRELTSGTPRFMAPECVRGAPADARSDLYAAGVLMRDLLQLVRESPAQRITRLVQRLCSRAPGERPADVQEVFEALGAPEADLGAACVEPAGLLGRAAQLELFEGMLGALVGGRAGARALCVSGCEGSGRTRLLRELKWRAQLDAAVVEAGCAGRRPVGSMLARALGLFEHVQGVAEVLRAREKLLAAGEAVVLVLDDADALAPEQLEMLHALVRSLEPEDPLLLVWSSSGAPPASAGRLEHVEIGPLAESDVASWAQGLVSPHRVRDLMRLTGGFPGAVRSLLAQVASGSVSELDLPRLRGGAPLSRRRLAELATMGEQDKRALALLAVLEEPAADADLAELGVSASMLARLVQSGWVKRDGAQWELARGAEAFTVLRALHPAQLAVLHEQVAERLGKRLREASDEATRSELGASAVVHLCAAGRHEPARDLLLAHEASWTRHPRTWPRAADAVLGASRDAEAVAGAVDVHLAAGNPDRALELVTSLLRSRPPKRALVGAWRRAGAAFLARGDARKALRYLRRAHGLERDPAGRAAIADLFSRALARRGDYSAALVVARRAARPDLAPRLQAALADDMGIAASNLGDTDEARACLERAETLHASVGDPRAQFHSVSYRAFNEYRSGNSTEAAHGYREALDIAKRHGLSDQLPHALLNVGVTCHQNGDWGGALGSYEHGLRLATALGQLGAEVPLRFNLAKLHADIGSLDRADALAERAQQSARDAGLEFFVTAAVTVEGETALGRGDASGARRAFAQAGEAFRAEGARREHAEVLLHLSEAAMLAGDWTAASSALQEAARTVGELGAEDLGAKLALARGRLALSQGEPAAAVRDLEQAQELAAAVGQRALEAEAVSACAGAWLALGAGALAERQRARSADLWGRIAASLPAPMADAFWRHPRRRDLPRPDQAEATEPARLAKLQRLLEINRKLVSSLRTPDVLAVTMDAAIELTGAERGFVLLADDPTHPSAGHTVAAARNLDRERIDRGHLKYSRGIAERCMATGEPIVTVDAGADKRFASNRSVHAMRLKSVVCVPIRARSGVLGAFYLDNRFQSGRFDWEDLDLLLAFGDQVAIALMNARLRAEVERRTEELEAERRRVAELMLDQTQPIGPLAGEARAREPVAEHRHDFGSIIGRSPRMQAVFAALDRVIDTSASVLIQGESGTGKELVARAVHVNGPRRERPFVAINCGAVPAALLESELFGHVRGAFTGADRSRDGLLVAAQGGTVFLDEIGDTPADMQVKLLRVLQERELRPLGSSKRVRVDFRLVCATNRSLRDEVAAGRFREDLFYRITVVEITLPPLRERREDLPDLCQHLLHKICDKLGRPAAQLDRSALKALLAHDWPGNVRELENVLTTALVMVQDNVIGARDLQLPAHGSPSSPPAASRAEFESTEAARIRAALGACAWNVSAVCRTLRIPRATLYRKLRRYGIRVGDGRLPAVGAAAPRRAGSRGAPARPGRARDTP